MQMRAIQKEMADGAYRISHILCDFPFSWKQTHTDGGLIIRPNTSGNAVKIVIKNTKCEESSWLGYINTM